MKKLPINKKITGVGLGVGIFKISSQIKDHRFHIAAIRHDASHDAYAIYSGKKSMYDMPLDYTYREYISLILDQQEKEKLSKYRYYLRHDRIFRDQCLTLAKGEAIYIAQAYIYYRLVRLYSLLK